MKPAHQRLEYKGKRVALIGYGVTGRSCAHFLLQRQAQIVVFDKNPQDISALAEQYLDKQDASTEVPSSIEFELLVEHSDLSEFDFVVVSPGVNLQQSFMQNYLALSKPVFGDIELFAQENTQKVIAVTGSNGKSTVVDMLAQSLSNAGFKVGLGGNFGTCALDLLDQNFDYIVLELSSFQLESTHSLAPEVACILNVTPDHIDRHGSVQAYADAKQRIYQHAKYVIYNRDDALTFPQHTFAPLQSFTIGLSAAKGESDFGQCEQGLCLGNNILIYKRNLPSINSYLLLNMQVVLACATALKIDLSAISECLINYKGLAHRFESVYEDQQCIWINDSKATNSGACIAALETLASQQISIVLIAGGDAKGADLSLLKVKVKHYVSAIILIGKDAPLFMNWIQDTQMCSSLKQAVHLAGLKAQELVIPSIETSQKVAVLLSPACASLDMFANYQDRGNQFAAAVMSEVAA